MTNEVQLDKVVYSTSNYEVRVCFITEPESGNELDVYGIFNLETGVREAELRGYPHSIKWCDNLQKSLDEIFSDRAMADAEAETIKEALTPDPEEAEVDEDGIEESVEPEPENLVSVEDEPEVVVEEIPVTREESAGILEALATGDEPELPDTA